MTQSGLLTPQRSRMAKRSLFGLIGPAFVAAIAYVDPGNVAANVSAGSQYGYLLIWVLVLANGMAVVIQHLSAKLGIVTGKTLPQLIGEKLPRWARLVFWLQAELVAAATDIAEIIGGALALFILLGIPTPIGGIIVTLISTIILAIKRHGQRRFENVIVGLLGIISVGFVAGVFVSPVQWAHVASGLIPRFQGTATVLLAVSMLGATVMPHAIYLHSGLAIDRYGFTSDHNKTRRLLAASRLDVTCALALAGSVNIAMLILAAAALSGNTNTDTILGAAHAISVNLGPIIGTIFGIGLLASGLASTTVGNYAGSMIMSGLLKIRVSIYIRRVVTAIPALILLAVGVNATWALVLSQVVLSFGIPCALIPLAWFTSRKAIMGYFANGAATRVAVGIIAVFIVILNALLLWLTFWG